VVRTWRHEVRVYLEPLVAGEAVRLAQSLVPLVQVIPTVYLIACTQLKIIIRHNKV
jgi:hypothetical protein